MANYRRILVGRHSARRWALVDPETYERLAAITWSAVANRDGHIYAVAKYDGRTVSMHRLVFGIAYDDPQRIEHINGNRLDNRRANLRLYEPRWESAPPVEIRPRPDGAVIQVGGTRPRRSGQPSVVMWARVDPEDVERLSSFNWSVRARNYGQADAITRIRRLESGGYALTSMHRLIMGLAPGNPLVVDHINGDQLDNRKTNLRVCTVAENGQNQHGKRRSRRGNASRFRGVGYNPRRKLPWTISLSFPTEEEANEWVVRYRREYMPFSEMDKLSEGEED